jgi:dsDNA-specific endonuclease/ATPase MutS2
VREILTELPMVAAFEDAPPQSGGWGATVAILKPAPGG